MPEPLLDWSGADERRNNNFGSLRLLFATLVVVSHSSELVDGGRSRELLTRVFGTLSLGDIAVDGFFLISGYLIIQSYSNARSIRGYLGKRVLRIYPGFVVASLISIVIVGPFAGGYLSQLSLTDVMKGLVLLSPPELPGAFQRLPYPHLNGALWTIHYEFLCYLLAIVFGSLARRKYRIGYVALLVGMAVFYIMRLDVPAILQDYLNCAKFARLIFVFFVGGAFYVWRDSIHYTRRRALPAAALLIALLSFRGVAEPAFTVLGGYLIFWYALGCRADIISRRMHSSDPSYGLYLYAWPIQNLLILNLPGISPWMVAVVALVVAMLLGVASWRLVEKNAVLFGKRCAAPSDYLLSTDCRSPMFEDDALSQGRAAVTA